MQTFLPYPSFARSAAVLDYRRLGKQRVEAKQIYLALTQPGYGWANHPATKMWRGYERALLRYGSQMCVEWRNRGYKDTLLPWVEYLLDEFVGTNTTNWKLLPPWYGDVAFHRSHQSNLIRKDPNFYGPLFPGVPDNLPYVWPTCVDSTAPQAR